MMMIMTFLKSDALSAVLENVVLERCPQLGTSDQSKTKNIVIFKSINL